MIGLINKLEANNIRISLDGDDLIIAFDGEAPTADLIAELKASKSDLVTYLKKINLAHRQMSDIKLIGPADKYAVSASQKRLWLISQMSDAASAAYHMPSYTKLNADLDPVKLEEAILKTIERHESLRTTFRQDGQGEVFQVVIPAKEFTFEIAKINLASTKPAEELLSEYVKSDGLTIFDLVNGPLLRVAILSHGSDNYIYFNLHHIIGDAWSMDIIERDVMQFYQAEVNNLPVDLPPLSIQYKDFAKWQNDLFSEDTENQSQAFWLNQLKGELPVLDLPISKKSTNQKSYRGEMLNTSISVETTRLLRLISKQTEASSFMILTAVWNVLYARYTGQKDVIIGTPVAGRNTPELFDQIGFYINTLILRNELDLGLSFEELLIRVKAGTLAAYEHQNYPFDKLVDELDLERNPGKNPVFEVLLSIQNTGERGELRLEKIPNEIEYAGDFGAKFDLELIFTEQADYIDFNLVYAIDNYNRKDIELLMRHFNNLLTVLVTNPQLKLNQAEFLTSFERDLFNNGEVRSYPETTVIEKFQHQARLNPDKVAVIAGEVELTYTELDEQSNGVANVLIEKGVLPEDIIPVCYPRSVEMHLAILGILKAGAAYLPIDIESPSERLKMILSEVNPKVILTSNTLKSIMPSDYEGDLIHLEELDNSQLDKSSPERSLSSGQLAYVIYTSGTTGVPKGVLNQHDALTNRLEWMREELELSGKDVFLQKTPFTFDVSVWELFMPITIGSTLVFAKPEGHKDPVYLKELINKEKISVIHFVPSMLEVFLDVNSLQGEWATLNHLICSGEELKESLVKKFVKACPSTKIHNYYGPTEAAIDVTSIELSKRDFNKEKLTIGKPAPNVELLIVNEVFEKQPVNVVGELLIGGVQVARGYFNREELSDSKFIELQNSKGARYYRTGDYAAWTSTGEIIFFGRMDEQVKIRGNRVELAEIESALILIDAIESALVIAREGNNGMELVAYLKVNGSLDENWANGLMSKLPAYMIPSEFAIVEMFPVGDNGKVDKKKLLQMDTVPLNRRKTYVAPENETQKEIATLWEEILDIEQVGINDDFFELGGHSLMAIRLVSHYHEKFDVKIEVNDIFSNATLLNQAVLIDRAETNHYEAIKTVPQAVSYPLSHSQKRLWILSGFGGGLANYNMPSVVELDGDYNVSDLEKAVLKVIERHEILRTVFKPHAIDVVHQFVLEANELEFKLTQKNFSDRESPEIAAEHFIEEDAYTHFDLENGPLFKVVFLKLTNGKALLYYNMHHIISDAWSHEILGREVLAYYDHFQSGIPVVLPELSIQHKDFVLWQNLKEEAEEFHGFDAYWSAIFKDDIPKMEFPFEKNRPDIYTSNGATVEFTFPKSLFNQLSDLTKRADGTLYVSLLAIVKLLLNKQTGNTRVMVGSSLSMRTHKDLENQIGFFVNNLPVLTQINDEMLLSNYYQEVAQNVRDVMKQAHYPLERLLESINYKYDKSTAGLFNVFVELANKTNQNTNTQLNEGEIIFTENVPSKFDLAFEFFEGEQLTCVMNFNTDLFERRHIELLINRFLKICEAFIKGFETEKVEAISIKKNNPKKLLTENF